MLDLGPELPEQGRYGKLYREINIIKRCIRALTPVKSLNLLTNVTGIGTSREALPVSAKAPSGKVKQYLVKSVHDDYITCWEFNGSSSTGSDVLVAKPFNLRKTGWDGLTVTYPIEPYPSAPGTSIAVHYTYVAGNTQNYRVATIGTGASAVTEHQVIIPRYVADKSVIFASQSENTTGVTSADWLDINADGRAWARVA